MALCDIPDAGPNGCLGVSHYSCATQNEPIMFSVVSTGNDDRTSEGVEIIVMNRRSQIYWLDTQPLFPKTPTPRRTKSNATEECHTDVLEL